MAHTGTCALSDMNGNNVGGALGWWLRLYWAAFALILGVLAHLLWRRGTETRADAAAARACRRGWPVCPGVLIAGAALVIRRRRRVPLSGTPTSSTNTAPATISRRAQAEYEKKYLKYEKRCRSRRPPMIRLRSNSIPRDHRMEAPRPLQPGQRYRCAGRHDCTCACTIPISRFVRLDGAGRDAGDERRRTTITASIASRRRWRRGRRRSWISLPSAGNRAIAPPATTPISSTMAASSTTAISRR